MVPLVEIEAEAGEIVTEVTVGGGVGAGGGVGGGVGPDGAAVAVALSCTTTTGLEPALVMMDMLPVAVPGVVAAKATWKL